MKFWLNQNSLYWCIAFKFNQHENLCSSGLKGQSWVQWPVYLGVWLDSPAVWLQNAMICCDLNSHTFNGLKSHGQFLPDGAIQIVPSMIIKAVSAQRMQKLVNPQNSVPQEVDFRVLMLTALLSRTAEPPFLWITYAEKCRFVTLPLLKISPKYRFWAGPSFFHLLGVLVM